jgi:hypothetical protein
VVGEIVVGAVAMSLPSAAARSALGGEERTLREKSAAADAVGC